MDTYYITGVTGFLGYNLVKLLPNNVKIVGLALENDPNISLYASFDNVTIVKGNILNKEDIRKFLSTNNSESNYLIHAAGKITTLKKGDPSVMKINVEGTKNIVNEVKNRNFKKVIYISSVDSMKYRKDKDPVIEQKEYKEEETCGQYGKSKALASNYVKDNLNNYIVIMPSAILGPNDPLNSAINAALNKCINNKLPAIVNGGYNLVDVRDVAKGIIDVINSDMVNEYYLLTGHYISIKDISKKCTLIANSKKYKFVVPHVIIKMVAPFIEAKAKRKHKVPLFTGFSMDCLKQNSNYSYAKAKKDFGYEPRNLDETFKDTIEFLKNKNN